MIIKDKLINILKIYPECHKMYLAESSMMRRILKEQDKRVLRKINVILLIEHGNIIGWSWYYLRKDAQFNGFKYIPTKNKLVDYICLIKPDYRRKGFGKQIWDQTLPYLKKYKKKISIYPHDTRSEKFYNKVKNNTKIVMSYYYVNGLFI